MLTVMTAGVHQSKIYIQSFMFQGGKNITPYSGEDRQNVEDLSGNFNMGEPSESKYKSFV